MRRAAAGCFHRASFLFANGRSVELSSLLLKWRPRDVLQYRRTRLATCFAEQSSTSLFFHSHSGTTSPARCNSCRGTGAIRLPTRASPARMRFVESESSFRFCRSNRNAGFVRAIQADRVHKELLYSAQSARSLIANRERDVKREVSDLSG